MSFLIENNEFGDEPNVEFKNIPILVTNSSSNRSSSTRKDSMLFPHTVKSDFDYKDLKIIKQTKLKLESNLPLNYIF